MKLRILTPVAVWLVLLTACSEQAQQDDENLNQVDVRPLRVAAMGMPPSQGNPFGAVGPPSSTVWGALFDALTRLDRRGQLVASLATQWQAVDADTWRFELRPNVRFSNGESFDASSVVRLIDWVVSDQGRGSLVGNELRNIKGAEALTDLSVLIHTHETDAILPRRLSAMMIVEPNAWETLGPEGFGSQPVGTGPYEIKTWSRSGNLLVATKNPYSWRPANIDEIHFLALLDQAVRMQALLSGDVDLAIIGLEGIEQLRGRKYQIVTAPAMSVMAIAIVTTRTDGAPTTDPRVRQALNYAIDQTAIAQNILGRPEQAAGQPAARVTFGHNPALGPYPYDPDRARQLLAEAGYPNGFDFVIDVVIDAAPGDADIYQAVAQYLNEVGIRTRLRVQLFSGWLKDYNNGSWTGDAFSLAWNSAPYNDVQRPMEYYSCARPKPFFCDASMSEQLAVAAAEFDQKKRELLLQELSAQYREAAPAIFLIEQIMTWGVHPRVQNLSIASRVYEYERITFRTSYE